MLAELAKLLEALNRNSGDELLDSVLYLQISHRLVGDLAAHGLTELLGGDLAALKLLKSAGLHIKAYHVVGIGKPQSVKGIDTMVTADVDDDTAQVEHDVLD